MLVDRPGSLLAEQAGLIDLIAGQCNLLLNHALFGQRLAEGDTGAGTFGHQRQRSFSDPRWPACGGGSARTQAGLGDGEAIPSSASMLDAGTRTLS